MNSIPSDANARGFTGSAWAVGGAFLVLLAAMVFWTFANQRGGWSREAFTKISAAGDLPGMTMPEEIAPDQPLAVLEHKPLYPAEDPRAETRDSRMRSVGVDPASQATIYRCLEEEEAGYWFIKTGVDRYLRLTGTPPDQTGGEGKE